MPLRQGAHPSIVALYRELIGAATLCAVAAATEVRPQLQPAVGKLLAASGAIFCGIRLTILGGLLLAGPIITAALVPLTPIFTLIIALAVGSEKLRLSSRSGSMQLAGMVSCTLFAMCMGLVKGPLLFGSDRSAAALRPPSNVPLGVFMMLLECFLAALVQIVNGKTLRVHKYPTVSTTAGVALCACCALFPCALVLAPSSAWRPTKTLIGACLYAGVFGTAVNNILLARANKRLGPTVANLYMPLQQLITALVDWLSLGDAVYLANVVCGVGVTVGLVFAVLGKSRGDAEAAAAAAAAAAGGGEGEKVGLLAGEEAPATEVELCAVAGEGGVK